MSGQSKPATETPASIGLRARSGRAIAVLLAGSVDAPSVVSRHDLALSDAGVPRTFQPYHKFLELAWPDAAAAVRPIERKIETIAAKELQRLVSEARELGLVVRGVGVVGSPDRDPGRIAHLHIRAHAAEGVLFRRVLETAARKSGLPCRALVEKELYQVAASELGEEESALRRMVAALGRGEIRPWRADEKMAALAAWVVQAAEKDVSGRERDVVSSVGGVRRDGGGRGLGRSPARDKTPQGRAAG